MKMVKTIIFLTIVLSILFFTNDLISGIFMIEKDGTETYISNGRLKEISKDDGMIMDSKSGVFTYFSPEKKIYTRGTISDFCEAMNQMMKQVIESMPPEYKEMMGVGQEQKPPKVEIVSEGDGGTIAGYKTEKYSILANGESYETVWLTTDASLIKEFKSLVGMLSEFQKCSKMMDFGAPPVEFSPEYVQLMEKGLTLKSIEIEAGMETSIINTVSLELKDIADAEFQIPADYQEMSFVEYFGSQMEDEMGEF